MGDDWGRGQVKTRVLGYQHPLVGVQMLRLRHYAYVLYSTESPRVALAKFNGSCIVLRLVRNRTRPWLVEARGDASATGEVPGLHKILYLWAL